MGFTILQGKEIIIQEMIFKMSSVIKPQRKNFLKEEMEQNNRM